MYNCNMYSLFYFRFYTDDYFNSAVKIKIFFYVNKNIQNAKAYIVQYARKYFGKLDLNKTLKNIHKLNVTIKIAGND